ncbi:MAG: glycerophosphodiester phosphodiesterase [Terrimicrobiaceae bacterium]|nr:glycerophosphodiester phosphodiesterase [Terrimicrobiaceae bacterium]
MNWITAPAFLLVAIQSAMSTTVIAHRGASGFLPEHTLEAKAYAHALGADFIEQDVVLTKDDQAIVLHDIHLDATTNVAEVFPGRSRPDGRFYAIDFTLEEIRRLQVRERIDPGTGRVVYPGRFRKALPGFRVPTLEEEITFIQELNRTTGREAGIYPELKAPAFHQKEGKDIVAVVHQILSQHGYTRRTDGCIVQCFEVAPLVRLRNEFKSDLRLVQLIGEPAWKLNPEDYEKMITPAGLDEIAKYADGIGPALSLVLERTSDGPVASPLAKNAHARGLIIHPYTLRRDALPDGWTERDVWEFLDAAKIDGIFTDFPVRR